MTQAVSLREVTVEDLSLFFEQQRDPEASRMAAFIGRDPEDADGHARHWHRLLDDPTVRARSIVHDGLVVGHIASYVLDERTQITYWIGRAHWGRGFATAALETFLEEVPTRPLYASAAADNAASLRVLERCGFRVHGRERAFARARGAEIEEVLLTLEKLPCAR